MQILGAVLFVVILLVCLALTSLGMPGNWIMVAAAAVYAYLTPAAAVTHFGWPVVLALFLLAALGELIELVASALGVARGGGTRRGALLALGGSLAGAVVGLIVGLPIPVIGPLLAVLLFASLGAMGGAILGEQWAGRDLAASWRIGKAAFWGRLFGTLGKTLCGAIMVVVATIALCV